MKRKREGRDVCMCIFCTERKRLSITDVLGPHRLYDSV